MGAFDFIAVDLETANPWRASICQIGLVGFRGGAEVFAESWLIDPGGRFDAFNVGLHGIGPEHVAGAPTFAQRHGALSAILHGEIAVAHSAFDRGAISDACFEAGVDPPDAPWIDTVRVCRRVWPELPNHKLPTVAGHIGHSFRHHGAVEDARAAGLVLLAAMAAAGLSLEDCRRPDGLKGLPRSSREGLKLDGRDGDILSGETVVLTGDFLNRKADLAAAAAARGAAVEPGVNRRTTILVVGGRDPRFATDKSAKQVKAEALIAAGQPIVFFTEDQLVRLTRHGA